MNATILRISAVAAALAASTVLAGPPGQGYGPGNGAGAGPGAGPCATGTPPAGCGQGYGPGMGMGRGGGYGTSLLTPEERAAHFEAMHSFKTVDECNAYLAEHRQLVAERAAAQGLPVPPMRGNPCERMKARGFIS